MSDNQSPASAGGDAGREAIADAVTRLCAGKDGTQPGPMEAYRSGVRDLAAALTARPAGVQAEAIPAGMKPWHGGDSAPDDWDGRTVLFRNGSIQSGVGSSWSHPWSTGDDDEQTTPFDIIAYTPKPTTASGGVEREATNEDSLLTMVALRIERARKQPEQAGEHLQIAGELLAAALAQPESREGENARLREALRWYGEQARLCRLIHSEGDTGRQALNDDGGRRAREALDTSGGGAVSEDTRWPLGTRVEKINGSSWHGFVCGYYSTSLTPIGYAVESEREPGSVQVYPVKALRLADSDTSGGAQ